MREKEGILGHKKVGSTLTRAYMEVAFLIFNFFLDIFILLFLVDLLLGLPRK